MALRPPLYVENGSAGVTQPQDARLAQAGLMFGEPGVIVGNPGTVGGSTSGPNMKYTIPACVFALVRGTLSADGSYITANDGTVTQDSATPAPVSGLRYDLVWVRALNANDGFGDASSTPTFGVTVGTAAGSPTKPYASVPAGALVLAESLVGTGIANASLATITQVWGWVSSVGGILPCLSTARPTTGRYLGMAIFETDTGLLRILTQITPSVVWSAVQPSGPRGRITGGSRTTNSAAVSTEAVLTVNASFTLTETRRVRYELSGFLSNSLATTDGRIVLRRNTTGAAIATTDTRLTFASAQGGGGTAHITLSELLTAGTYGIGLCITGAGGGTATLLAASDFPCTLDIYDEGAS